MGYIKDEVLAAANRIDAEISELSELEGRLIRQQIITKYVSHENPHWLWEYFIGHSLVRNRDAWKWISEFIDDQICILFFNEIDDTAMFRLSSGHLLVKLLSECFLFEFYVTNEHLDYLLCENHHDIFYALGTAKEWLDKK